MLALALVIYFLIGVGAAVQLFVDYGEILASIFFVFAWPVIVGIKLAADL